MNAKQFPARPNLEQFRKQAKDLLKDLNSDQAVQRIKEFHPRFKQPKEGDLESFQLADAQLVIAREHVFESWPKFIKHIEEVSRANSSISQFELAADAIVTGDLPELERLLAQNPGLVHARSSRSHRAPLIHYVAANGVEDFRQKTPKNIVKITLTLLRAGAELDATTEAYGSACTALGLAATSYHPAAAGVQLELLDALLKAGACVDGAPGGWNPVVSALHNGRGDAALFLADRGAKLDLEAAAGTGRVESLSSFLSEDGSLQNGATKKQLDYGLVWACEYGHFNAVKFLLDWGVNPDSSPDCGETGLHWASYGGHADIVQLLIAARATVDAIETHHGGTPLGWALYGWNNPAPEFRNARYYEVVEFLARAGAKVDWDWINDPNRGSPINARIRSDDRMLRSLRGT